MQATYARYKELKRIIRDEASIDIQRYYRGYRTRSRGDISKFRTQRSSRNLVVANFATFSLHSELRIQTEFKCGSFSESI